MEEQNAKTPEAPGSNRQAEIDEKLRKLAQNLRKRRSRAKEKGERLVEWEASFDIERLSKGGGLIDVHEVQPFVDCETVQEYLSTARKFAYAFREKGEDCKDIQPGETINEFLLRVHKSWYAKPLGQSMRFVRLDNCKFDNDLSFRRNVPYDFNGWVPLPGSEKTLTSDEIATLPTVGKPVSEWRKQGFSTYVEWWESPSEELKRQNQDKENRKQKLRDELDKSEKSPESKRQNSSEPDGTPTLLYRGIITEL